MYSEIQVLKLNDIAHRWRPLIHKAIHDVLAQERYRNSGAGLASLTVDVTDGDTNKAPLIVVSFAEHLIFLDKRRLQWTRLPNIRKLMEWAELKTSDPKEARRLAWATAKKQRTTDAWKAKPWRKKSLGQVLKDMNAAVLREYDSILNEELERAIITA